MELLYIFAALIVTAQCTTIVISPSSSYAFSSSSAASGNGSNAINATSSIVSGNGSNATSSQLGIEQTSAPIAAATSTIAIVPSPSTIVAASSSVAANLTFGNLVNKQTKYQAKFTVVQTWEAALANKSSSKYATVSNNIIAAFDQLYQNDPYYKNTTINGLSQGSVKVDATISFEFPVGAADNLMANSTDKVAKSTTSIGSLTIKANSMVVVKSTDGSWGIWVNSGTCSSAKTITQVRTCQGQTGSGAACIGATSQTVSCTPSNAVANKMSVVGLSAALVVFSVFVL